MAEHPGVLTDPTTKADFLVQLGAAYLNHGLFEETAQILKRVPPHHKLYIEAAHHLIEAHQKLGNHEEVRRIGEDLFEKEEGSPWLSNRLGSAYYRLQQLDRAKEHLWSSLALVPGNEQVTEICSRLRPGNARFSLQAHGQELVHFGITRHSFIDGLAPVTSRARPATCCFIDQFSILSRPGSPAADELLAEHYNLEEIPEHIRIRMAFLVLARYLYTRFGITTAFMRYPEFHKDQCFPLAKIFFSTKPSLATLVTGIETAAWKEMMESDAKIQTRVKSLVPEGQLLGYPDCCIEWATEKRWYQGSYEKEALMVLLKEECAFEIGGAKTRPEHAYFAFEFFPCHPRCSAAEKKGQEILASYQSTDPEIAMLHQNYALPLNKARIRFSHDTYESFMIQYHQKMDTKGAEE